MPIEEVASWPWEKRYLYHDALVAAQEYEQASMPEMPDVDGQMPTGSQMPSGASMPSGTQMPSMGGGNPSNVSKNVSDNIAQHEHVIKNQNS